MRKGCCFVFMILVIVVTACSRDEPDSDMEDSPGVVVEGYIYANEPVRNLRISTINPNGSAELIPVNDAVVYISQSEKQIQLLPTTADSGIYAQTDTLSYLLTDSAEVKLDIQLKGNTYSASTVFPKKLTGLQISNPQISVLPGNSTDTVATLSWNPIPGAAGYCIFIRNITSNYGPLGQNSQIQPVFNHPVTTTSVYFVSTDFQFTGSFQIYVSAINMSYAAMYQNQTNTIIDGTTNIQNGWGIFTGFNGEAVQVSVQ